MCLAHQQKLRSWLSWKKRYVTSNPRNMELWLYVFLYFVKYIFSWNNLETWEKSCVFYYKNKKLFLKREMRRALILLYSYNKSRKWTFKTKTLFIKKIITIRRNTSQRKSLIIKKRKSQKKRNNYVIISIFFCLCVSYCSVFNKNEKQWMSSSCSRGFTVRKRKKYVFRTYRIVRVSIREEWNISNEI